MWPASYIWSFLNRYFDFENTLNIKKLPVLSQKQHQNQFTLTCTGLRIPNLSLMRPSKPKELPTPALTSLMMCEFFPFSSLICKIPSKRKSILRRQFIKKEKKMFFGIENCSFFNTRISNSNLTTLNTISKTNLWHRSFKNNMTKKYMNNYSYSNKKLLQKRE